MGSMNKRNLEIDRLRAIVMIMVMLAHFTRIYFPSSIKQDIQFLTTLMDLLMVISGYVISTVLVEWVDQFKGSASALVSVIKAFYIRRIWRIYPVACFVMLSVIAVSYFSMRGSGLAGSGSNAEAIYYYLTFRFNYYFISNHLSLALAPYWTLALEEQFYLIFPLFLLLTRSNRSRMLILVCVLALIIFVIRPLTLQSYPLLGLFFTQTRFDGFIYGYFIYCISNQSWFRTLSIPESFHPLLRTMSLLLIIYLLCALTVMPLSMSMMITLGAFLSFLIVLAAARECEIIIFPPLIQKGLDVMAPRAYSAYLTHMPAFLLMDAYFKNSSWSNGVWSYSRPLVALTFTAICIECVYQWIEKPSLQKGRRISRLILQRFQYAAADAKKALYAS